MTGFLRFLNDDEGAVTIDWVALTAGLLILAVGIIAVLGTEVQSLVDTIKTQISAANSGYTVS